MGEDFLLLQRPGRGFDFNMAHFKWCGPSCQNNLSPFWLQYDCSGSNVKFYLIISEGGFNLNIWKTMYKSLLRAMPDLLFLLK